MQAPLLAAADRFDESFYATSAQVIPVLLLTLVFQLRLGRRHQDEPLGVSLWLLALFLAMALGELSAFVALSEHKNLSKVGDDLIWGSLTWGTMVIAGLPIFRRWDAVHAAIPSRLSLVIRYGLWLAIFAVVFLVLFGLVGGNWLIGLGAVLVFLLLLAGMVVTDVQDRRGLRAEEKKEGDKTEEADETEEAD